MALLDPYTGSWTSVEAAHLARRTTFGATPDALAALVSAGMSAAVDSIADYQMIDQPLEDSIANLPATSDNNLIKNPIRIQDLEGWWLYRTVHSSQPFQQQFALFLHDHFVSEYGKIQTNVSNASNLGNDGSVTGQSCNLGINGIPPDPDRERKIIVRLLRDQHNLFLTQGHDSFRNMLIKITRDPCMLIYLDNRVNIKGRAQENYGREVMELFSMGVGNYSEEDVRAAARAFTGETIAVRCQDNWSYSYVYRNDQHDIDLKTVFGSTFNSSYPGSDDTIKVIDLILNHVSGSNISPNHSVYPATALYMSWKFINWFVSHDITIDHPAVGELADYFYNNTSGGGFNYNVRETLRKLFKSQFFYDQAFRFNMYKHPVDYFATALRSLELDEPRYVAIAAYKLREMGMRLFEPPTVEGWHHGRSWINSSSLIARFNYADNMSKSGVMSDTYIDLLQISGQITDFADEDGILRYFSSRLLMDSFTPEETTVFKNMFQQINTGGTAQTRFRRKVRAALHLTMTMPRYQLK